LVKRGLVEVVGSAPAPDGKNNLHLYQAVLARGEIPSKCPNQAKPSAGADSGLGQDVGHRTFQGNVSRPKEVNGTPPESEGTCPASDACIGVDSAQMGQSEQYPRARDDGRTKEESDALKDQAWSQWDA
jgi:hypothetical protein